MPEVKPIKRGRGRPPGAKNKPKLIAKEEPKKPLVDVGINSLHPSLRISKEIRRLAEVTGFTLKRIFDDMCEAGVIEIQTMYLEVINARREIQKALDTLDGKITAKRSVGPAQGQKTPVRNGTDSEKILGSERSHKPGERAVDEQPDIAFEQRGLATPPRAHPESLASSGGVDPEFANSFEDPTVTEPENEPEESEEEMEEQPIE